MQNKISEKSYINYAACPYANCTIKYATIQVNEIHCKTGFAYTNV